MGLLARHLPFTPRDQHDRRHATSHQRVGEFFFQLLISYSLLSSHMHARHQLEIAGWIAANAESIINTIDQTENVLLETYWLSMKTRTSRWNAALKTFERDLESKDRDFNPWPALEIILEEIVVAESLTRVWSAVIVSFDLHLGVKEFSPLAHSVFISHMETRNRVIRLLLRSRGENELVFDRINQLRRSVEKWTDLFLGLLPCKEIARNFSFDSKRHEDFSREGNLGDPELSDQRVHTWLASAEKTFAQQCKKWSANPELNRRIVEGIFACIPNQLFESSELPPLVASLWREKSHANAQALIDRLSLLDT